MRFRHKVRNMKYTVRPSQPRVEGGIRMPPTVPLRAEFRDHYFDSLEAQKRLGWTDEERDAVERWLLDHRDLHMPNYRLSHGGLYLDEERPQAAQPERIPADSELRCIFTFPTDDGGVEQCGQTARPNSDYCDSHYAVVATAAATKR